MLSAYLFCKHSPIKRVAKNPISCLILFHKSQWISTFIIPRAFGNHCFINFCSIVEANDSGYGVKLKQKSSFTVSYLVNSCGLSAERANLLSERVNFKTPEKPDAVLAFLRDQGFSKTHIKKLVKTVPKILLYNPDKTLLPKIEFFRSIWVSRTDLANTLSANQHLLMRSLDKHILPLFNWLKSKFGTDGTIASKSLWRAFYFCKDPIKNLAANIAVLKEVGVPESCIRMFLAHFPLAIMQKNDQFKKVVSEVKEMGFDPLKSMFGMAIHARSGKRSRTRWERCYEVYSSWGWSEDNISRAYRVHPYCMLISELNLNRKMNFLVSKMGWNSQMIARSPTTLCYSLEKRIIPRGSVIHLLYLKGLIKNEKDVSLSYSFTINEKKFMAKFVTPFVRQVPQLPDVYQGKMAIFDA